MFKLKLANSFSENFPFWTWIRVGIGGVFAIAAMGVLGWHLHVPDHLGIALALALLCVDQGRMALVDLDNIRQVTLSDHRVRQFHGLILSTLAIELVGFYLAWRWLGLGTALVLMSQLLFNAIAKIQLEPNRLDPIQFLGLKQRSPVILANMVALSLVILWQTGHWPYSTATSLLALVLIYFTVKYCHGE